jgi:hypothetical protein
LIIRIRSTLKETIKFQVLLQALLQVTKTGMRGKGKGENSCLPRLSVSQKKEGRYGEIAALTKGGDAGTAIET